MATMLTHAMTLMALVRFFCFKISPGEKEVQNAVCSLWYVGLFFIFRRIDLLKQFFHFKHMIECIVEKESQFGHAP